MVSVSRAFNNNVAFHGAPAQKDREKTRFGVDRSDIISFLVAGTALFGSLAVGSSASLMLSGGNAFVGAILASFLEIGLWAVGGFLALVAVAFATAPRYHR
jgi:hypothetical protein